MKFSLICIKPERHATDGWYFAVFLFTSFIPNKWCTPPPKPGYSNATQFGVSTGRINRRDADFLRWSPDYTRKLGGRWSSGAAIMWDRETEYFSDKPSIEVDSFTAAGMLC
jgi:hypothetical protein